MSLNNISLTLDIDPEVAWALIDLLDQLRESVALTYTDDIQVQNADRQGYLLCRPVEIQC